jgi:phage terminase large subunit-like protein
MGVEPGKPVGFKVKRFPTFGAFLQSSLVVRPGTLTTPWSMGSIQAGRP